MEGEIVVRRVEMGAFEEAVANGLKSYLLFSSPREDRFAAAR